MAPREGDKPAAGMLRKSLASSQVEGACPDPEILAAYVDRSLDADEIRHWELHFSECAGCREHLAAMVRAGEVVATGGEAREPGSAWAWLRDWRLMVPAFAVLMIAAGIWYAGRGTQPRLVAMSTPSESLTGPMALPALPETNGPVAATPPTPAPPAATSPSGAAEAKTEREFATSNDEIQALKKSQNAFDATTAANQPSVAGGSAMRAPAPAGEQRQEAAAADQIQKSADAAGVAAQSAALPAAPPPPAPDAAGQPAPAAPRAMAGGTLSGVAGFGAARVMTRNKETLAAPAAAPAAQDKTSPPAQDAAKSASPVVIHSPDPQIMWRIADAGFVERTTDGGETWEGQLPGPETQLADGSAPAAKVCWLVGSGGVILLTTDGNTWKMISPPAAVDFVAVTAKSASSATVSAADGRKFATPDGGKHWNPAP